MNDENALTMESLIEHSGTFSFQLVLFIAVIVVVISAELPFIVVAIDSTSRFLPVFLALAFLTPFALSILDISVVAVAIII